MTLKDMANKKDSGYANEATQRLILELINTPAGAFQWFIDQSTEQLETKHIKYEMTLMFEHWKQGHSGGYAEFAKLVISDWLSNCTHWFDWPTIVSIYNDPGRGFADQSIGHEEKNVASLLLSSKYYNPIIAGSSLASVQGDMLLYTLQGILKEFDEPEAWITEKNSQEWALAQHIFTFYLESVDWTEVQNEIIQAKEERRTIMKFKDYNGSENFPTWSANLIISNDSDVREELQAIAQRGTLQEAVVDVRHHIETMVEEWWFPFAGDDAYVSPLVRTFMETAIRDSIREANWTLIRDSLAKKNHVEKDDEINYAIVALYRTLLNWRKVAKEYLHKQENREVSSGGVLQEIALQDTLYDALDEWISSSKQRAMPLYALNDYARKVYTVWFAAIDWERIARALRGEGVK